MPRGQFVGGLVDRIGMRHVLIGQELIDGCGRQGAVKARCLGQRLEFATKQQLPIAKLIKQRLLPQPIASQHELPLVAIPNRNRKHSIEMLEALQVRDLRRDVRSFPNRYRCERYGRSLLVVDAARDSCRSRR